MSTPTEHHPDGPARPAPAAVLAPRRGGAPDAKARRLVPTVARWALEVDRAFEAAPTADAAAAVVRRCLADYRSGRTEAALRSWHDDIAWHVMGQGPAGGTWTGADGVFEYHGLVERLSEGTFRQRLVALEGSRGPIVDAYLRTTARRGERRLDIPTLAVFELAAGRIRRVTEVPGDLAAWEAFWAD